MPWSVSKLLIDNRLEGLERLGTRQKTPVDEESGRAGHTRLLAFALILHDLALELARIDTGVETFEVKADAGRMTLQILVRECLLVLEDLVVEFPEFALLVGAKGRLGRRQCPCVVPQRKVAKDNPDLVAIGLTNLLEGRTDPCTVRSLEIHVFDNRNLGA